MRSILASLLLLLCLGLGQAAAATSFDPNNKGPNVTLCNANELAAIGVCAQDPGPSQALFNNPYYSCQTTRYVADAAHGGSNSNNGTQATQGTGSNGPWATWAFAITQLPSGTGSAGYCLTGVSGSSWTTGATIDRGGSAASGATYLVLGCQTMGACTITDNGQNNCAASGTPLHAAFAACANYLYFDGFVFTASSFLTNGEAIGVAGTSSVGYNFSYHHIWATNNTVSGYGQAGFQWNQGEYFYAIHNTFSNNAQAANCDSSAQGSGVSIGFPISASGYSPVGDDTNNKVTGNTGSLFKHWVMWNLFHNNQVTPCASTTLTAAITSTTQTSINVAAIGNFPIGSLPFVIIIDNEYLTVTAVGGSGNLTWTVSRHTSPSSAATHSNGATVNYTGSTDGNGFIADTWIWNCNSGGTYSPGSCSSGASVYTGGALVAFNISYNNGGAGFINTSSPFITFANNSCYQGYMDPNNFGAQNGRACISDNQGYATTFINNVAYAIGASGNTLTYNTGIAVGGTGATITATLNGSISNSALTVNETSNTNMPGASNGWPLNANSTLPAGNMVKIDSEYMLVCSWSATSFTVCSGGRGFYNSTATSHTSGATITWIQDYPANNVTFNTGASVPDFQPYNSEPYDTTLNKTATNPSWTNVGNTSPGTISTPPNGSNFALAGGSPAIGFGQTSTTGQNGSAAGPITFLPAQSIDAGACSSSLSTCP